MAKVVMFLVLMAITYVAIRLAFFTEFWGWPVFAIVILAILAAFVVVCIAGFCWVTAELIVDWWRARKAGE
jgi:hypothetical protein